MNASLSKRLLTFLITAVILLNPMKSMAQDESGTSTGILDESVQDLTVVLGSGVVGAVLGLSTLSFVDEPKDHFKNVAIGGAIGIVVGVGIVIFGQATKSQSIMTNQNPRDLTPESSESMARLDFSKQKIAESYTLPTTVGYNFTF